MISSLGTKMPFFMLSRRGIRDAMVTVEVNGYSVSSSNPELCFFAFPVSLIPLGKVWLQIFFLLRWINSRVDLSLILVWQQVQEKENCVKLRSKIDFVLNPARAERFSIYIYIYIYIRSPPRRLSTLAKESSSNELSTPVSDKAKM